MPKTYTIKIEPDQDPPSPREWDNLGTMVCAHRNYDLGDEQSPTNSGIGDRLYLMHDHFDDLCRIYRVKGESWDWCCDGFNEHTLEYRIEENPDPFQELYQKHFIELPLYLYDHSGITMRTSPFSCRWDSGQVGFIYVSKDKIRKEFSVKRISPKLLKWVYACLKDEVKTYDQYLTNDVYGFTIEDEDQNHIDSCWGFYSEEQCREEAQSMVDWYIKQDQIQKQNRLKIQIQNHVPLQIREKELNNA